MNLKKFFVWFFVVFAFLVAVIAVGVTEIAKKRDKDVAETLEKMQAVEVENMGYAVYGSQKIVLPSGEVSILDRAAELTEKTGGYLYDSEIADGTAYCLYETETDSFLLSAKISTGEISVLASFPYDVRILGITDKYVMLFGNLKLEAVSRAAGEKRVLTTLTEYSDFSVGKSGNVYYAENGAFHLLSAQMDYETGVAITDMGLKNGTPFYEVYEGDTAYVYASDYSYGRDVCFAYNLTAGERYFDYLHIAELARASEDAYYTVNGSEYLCVDGYDGVTLLSHDGAIVFDHAFFSEKSEAYGELFRAVNGENATAQSGGSVRFRFITDGDAAYLSCMFFPRRSFSFDTYPSALFSYDFSSDTVTYLGLFDSVAAVFKIN